jgi:hypothetical protein
MQNSRSVCVTVSRYWYAFLIHLNHSRSESEMAMLWIRQSGISERLTRKAEPAPHQPHSRPGRSNETYGRFMNIAPCRSSQAKRPTHFGTKPLQEDSPQFQNSLIKFPPSQYAAHSPIFRSLNHQCISVEPVHGRCFRSVFVRSTIGVISDVAELRVQTLQ